MAYDLFVYAYENGKGSRFLFSSKPVSDESLRIFDLGLVRNYSYRTLSQCTEALLAAFFHEGSREELVSKLETILIPPSIQHFSL